MIITNLKEYEEVIPKPQPNGLRVPRYEILYYRGQNNVGFKLCPTIARNSNNMCCFKNLLHYENEFIQKVINNVPELFRDVDKPLDLLAVLQHYGVPTRLLDVTKNSKIALYFACKGEEEKDGEVIIFANNELYYGAQKSIYQAIAQSYKFSEVYKNSEFPLNKFYDLLLYENLNVVEKYNLQKTSNSDEYKIQYVKTNSHLELIDTKMINSRQKNQKGYYILFPNKIGQNCYEQWCYKLELEELKKEIYKASTENKNVPDLYIKDILTIPKECKKDILKELEKEGINESKIYPDKNDYLENEVKKIMEQMKEKVMRLENGGVRYL